MSTFRDNTEVEQMPISEKYSWWISLFKLLEKALMGVEVVALIFFAIMYLSTISIKQGYEIPTKILGLILLLFSFIIIFSLVEMQRVSFCMAVGAFGTKGKKDDAFFILLSLAITVLIWGIEAKGSVMFLNFTNSYDPKIESVGTDVRVKSNESQRKKIESERAQKESSLRCAECLAIKANFDSKIVNARSKMRSGENGVAWKIAENNKLRNSIKRLEAQRESEIAQAQSRFEDMKNKTLESYDMRIMSLDTMQIRVKSSIDSANNEEKGKVILQQNENKKYGGLFTIFTQLMLIVLRSIQAWIQHKDGKSFVQIGEFMKGVSFLNIPIDWLKLEYAAFIERNKHTQRARVLKAVDNVNDHKEKIINGDSRRAEFINNDLPSFEDGVRLDNRLKAQHQPESVTTDVETSDFDDEKKNEIIEENVDNTSEKDIILAIIKAFEIALDYEDSEDSIREINGIIQAFKIALDFV